MDTRGMLPIYYDAEFTGLHRNTSLISIGLVSASGSYFYAEFTDYDKSQVDDWIKTNVLQNMLISEDIPMCQGVGIIDNTMLYNVSMKHETATIAEALRNWLKNESAISGQKIQIYCDCYAYDWMLFNDFICKDGQALNLPDYVYYIPVDLSSVLQTANIDPDITREDMLDKDQLEAITTMPAFKSANGVIKHNPLWDAYVAMSCYRKVDEMS